MTCDTSSVNLIYIKISQCILKIQLLFFDLISHKDVSQQMLHEYIKNRKFLKSLQSIKHQKNNYFDDMKLCTNCKHAKLCHLLSLFEILNIKMHKTAIQNNNPKSLLYIAHNACIPRFIHTQIYKCIINKHGI